MENLHDRMVRKEDEESDVGKKEEEAGVFIGASSSTETEVIASADVFHQRGFYKNLSHSDCWNIQ